MRIKRYRFVIVPTLVISAAMLSLIFVVPGQIRGLTSQWREIESIKENVREQKAKYLLISSLDKEKLEQQASLAVAALPEDKNVFYVLRGIKDLCAEVGFLVKSLKFAPGEISKGGEEKKLVKKRIEELPITLKVVGTFGKINDFFEAVENRLPLFQIKDIELVNSGKTGESVNLKLELVTFYSPPPSIYKKEVVKLEDLILSEKESDFLNNLSGFKQTAVVGGKSQPSEGKKRDNPFLF